MDHEAGMEGQDAKGLPPLIAVLAGCALLVAAALLLPRFIAPPALPVLLAAGAGTGLLLWLIALAVEVRRAPLWWKLASLALLVGLGVLSGLLFARAGYARTTYDASSFAEAEIGNDGTLTLPAGAAERGPVSRRAVEGLAAIAAVEERYAQAGSAVDLSALNSPYQLSQAPEVLENCEAIGELQDAARAADRDVAAEREALEQAVASADFAQGVSRGVALMVGPSDVEGDESLLTGRLALLDATQSLCRLLARGSWTNESGRFGFRNVADRAAFAEISEQRRTASGVVGTALRNEREQRTRGQEIVRQALSR